MDVPAEWISDEFSALLVDKRQLGAPTVVVAAIAALSAGQRLEFVRTEMIATGDETRWDVLAVTEDLLIKVEARREKQDWHAGNEQTQDRKDAVVSGSARPLADAVGVEVTDVRLRQFDDAWTMGCKISVTLSDGEMLTIVTDPHERSGDQFRQLFNVLGRAIPVPKHVQSLRS
jgi:hypothetical protein